MLGPNWPKVRTFSSGLQLLEFSGGPPPPNSLDSVGPGWRRKNPWLTPFVFLGPVTYHEWGTTLWRLEDSNFFSMICYWFYCSTFKGSFWSAARHSEIWMMHIDIYILYNVCIYTWDYICQGYDIWLYDLCMKYYSHSLAGVFFVAASKIHGFLPLTTKTPTEIPHENLIFDLKNWHTKILGTI